VHLPAAGTDKIMEQVKLIATTVVLTVLIWVTADSLVSETVKVGVTFDLQPADAAVGMLVEAGPEARSAEIQVVGPRRVVDGLDPPLRVRLPVADLPTGPRALPLQLDVLQQRLTDQYSEFRKLRVVAVTPARLPIEVDHLIERKFDVILRPLTLAYDVEPQVSRNSVTVRMRESAAQELDQAGQPAELNIAGEFERLVERQPAGESVTITVRLDNRLFGVGAELIPPTVDVTATLKAQRRTATVPTVPILLAVSFANLERPYRAVTPDGGTLVTRAILVTGPADAVARLLRGETRAYGVIQLKEADLVAAGTPRLATPDFHLPPGVELAEDPAPVEFRLIEVPREAP